MARQHLLDMHGIAEFFGVCRRTAYEFRKDPSFPAPVILGPRLIRFRVIDLEHWVERRQAADAMPRDEPAQLAAGKARRRALGGSAGGIRGRTAGPLARNQRPSRASAEGFSVEPPEEARK